MADAPPPPPGTSIEEDAPAPPHGTSVEPPPPPGTAVEEGSPLLKVAGQVASFLPRAGRALGVGAETILENTPPGSLRAKLAAAVTDPAIARQAIDAGRDAFQPGFQPKPGQKLGAGIGVLAGSAPEIMAAGEIAPAFLPEAPALTTLARAALGRAAHSAAVFAATGALDTTAEQAALTGKIDPMHSLKAAAGGAVTGAALGAAGAVPALVSGKLPEAVTKVLSDEIASRIFGASVAGAVGAGAAAVGGGTKEEIAAHGAGFFLMDILGNASFDAQYKQAAKDSAIEPLVKSMVDSGMDPAQAIPQARGMLESVLKETGNASQVIRESPQYAEAVRFMAGEYIKDNPGMDPVGAEALARRRLEVGFANREMTIAELKKLKLSLTPAETAPEAAAEPQPAVPGVEGLPAPEGSSEAPAPPQAAPQPNPGDRVVVPRQGGFIEGKVIGYDHESGHPRVEVTGAHGETPPGELGDIVTAAPEAMHAESAPESWEIEYESPGEPTGEESKLVRGPAPSVGQMTPDEWKERFPGVPQAVYVKAMAARLEAGHPVPPEAIEKHPELAEIAKELDVKARWQELVDQGVSGREQPIMDLIRARGGMDIAELKESGSYGELSGQDLMQRGLARHGGPIRGWDHAAELAFEAGLIPDYDMNTLIDAVHSEARKGRKGDLVADAYEKQFPKAFDAPPARQEWMPERTKAALDAAGLKAGSDVTSYGFLDADHGRIKRGEVGKLIAPDLANGRLLIDFGGKHVLADPRDIKETFRADREAAAPPAAPSGRAVKKGVEAATGLTDPDEKMIELAESEVLRIKLLNQQKGSIVGAQAARRELLGRVRQMLREGKDVKKVLGIFIREGLSGLEIGNTATGKLVNAVATAKNTHDMVRAEMKIEQVVDAAYSKQLRGEIKKIWDRSQGAPGVEIDWQKRMQEARSDVQFVRPTAENLAKAWDRAEYIAHADETGAGDAIDPRERERVGARLLRPLADLTSPELEELRDTMLSLEKTGRQAQAFKDQARLYRKLRAIQLRTEGSTPLEARPQIKADEGRGITTRDSLVNWLNSSMDFWQGFGRPFLMPHAMAEIADGRPDGPETAAMRVTDAAITRALNRANDIRTPLRNLIDRLKITPTEYFQVAASLVHAQDGGDAHLANTEALGGNLTPENRVTKAAGYKLSPRQEQLKAEILKITNDPDIFEGMKAWARAELNLDMKKVDNHYPFVGQGREAESADLHEQLAAANNFAGKTVAHGTIYERKIGADNPIRLDYQAFENHIYRMAYAIEAGRAVRANAEVVNSPQYANAKGPLVTKWMRAYATGLTRRGQPLGQDLIPLLDQFNRKIGSWSLGYRLVSAAVHASTLPAVMREIGPARVIAGMAKAGTPEAMAFMEKHSPAIRSSLEKRPGSELASGQPNQNNPYAMAAFNGVRRYVSGGTFMATFDHWYETRGISPNYKTPDPRALQSAEEMVVKYQGSPVFKDMAIAYYSRQGLGQVSLNRAALLFHQPILPLASEFRLAIGQLGWGEDKGEAMGRLAALVMVVGAAAGIKWAGREAYDAFMGGLLPDYAQHHKADSIWKEFGRQALTLALPVGGANLLAAAQFRESGVPVVDVPVKGLSDLYHGAKLAMAQKRGDEIKALRYSLMGIAGVASMVTGMPGGGVIAEVLNDKLKSMGPQKMTIPRPPRLPRP